MFSHILLDFCENRKLPVMINMLNFLNLIQIAVSWILNHVMRKVTRQSQVILYIFLYSIYTYIYIVLSLFFFQFFEDSNVTTT